MYWKKSRHLHYRLNFAGVSPIIIAIVGKIVNVYLVFRRIGITIRLFRFSRRHSCTLGMYQTFKNSICNEDISTLQRFCMRMY